MITTKNISVVVIVSLLTLLISFGCADVIVDPEVNVDGFGVSGDSKTKARESFLYTVDLTTQTFLKVEGKNGSVAVQSVSGTNQVTISGEKIVGSGTYLDAYSHLKNITIEINELTNELLVKTLQSHYSDGRSYNVNYTIGVPSQLNVVVENVNGEINAKLSVPQNGSIDMSLQNGTIELNIPQNTSADLSASLVNGSILLQNLTLHNRAATSMSLRGRLGDGQGMITLRTTNGKINVLGF